MPDQLVLRNLIEIAPAEIKPLLREAAYSRDRKTEGGYLAAAGLLRRAAREIGEILSGTTDDARRIELEGLQRKLPPLAGRYELAGIDNSRHGNAIGIRGRRDDKMPARF